MKYKNMDIEQSFSLDNPFYDNHLFTKEDIKRLKFKWWYYPSLWFIPMKVQLNDGGVFYYKTFRGQYYFYKYENLFKS